VRARRVLCRDRVVTRSLWGAAPPLAGLLLAAAALGLVDAAVALWANRAVAPHATLPLCLTAPFVVAVLVLAPFAAALAIAARVCGRVATTTGCTASLLGLAAGFLVLRAAGGLRGAWAEGGAHALAAALVPMTLIVAASAGALVRVGVRARLARLADGALARLVGAALLLHVAALGGVAWQVAREGRGVVADLLTWHLLLPGGDPGRTAVAQAPRVGSPVARSQVPANLVLVTIDTLRADHLDAARMPRTDALATRGARFTSAFAASSWTLPSMASLMTGLPVARHGAGVALGVDPLARRPLGTEHATLATVLRGAGFETRAIVTNPYLGLGYGLGRGFDAFENVTLESEAALTLRPTTGFGLLVAAFPSLAIVDRGDAVTRRAARFLADPRRPERFFLWLHYVDPHAPYAGAARSFRDDLLAGGVDGPLPRMAQLRAGEIRPTASGRQALRDAYATAVRAVDAEVGAVADLLAAHGLASRTLLAVTADHGEELWDHGGVEHGHTLYDEVARVPLVLVHPGSIAPGLVVDALVGTAALAPTLLDLLGVAPVPSASALLPSAGFAATLRGAAFVERPVVSESLLFAEERTALRTARHTYVVWPNGKEELYDRRRDPRELRDLAARRRLLRAQRSLLAAERDSPAHDVAATSDLPAGSGAGSVSGVGASGNRDVNELTRRALRALGYVE